MNTTYIGILRGINVSGQKKILMKEFRAQLEAAGFQGVETYIQSGNVVFQGPAEQADAFKAKMEAVIRDEYGWEVPIMVLTAADWHHVQQHNPFLAEAPDRDIKELYVAFLDAVPQADNAAELATFVAEQPEEAYLVDQVVYLRYPNGAGTTKLDNGRIERKLKVTSTSRNWRTVCKLDEMAAARGA